MRPLSHHSTLLFSFLWPEILTYALEGLIQSHLRPGFFIGTSIDLTPSLAFERDSVPSGHIINAFKLPSQLN